MLMNISEESSHPHRSIGTSYLVSPFVEPIHQQLSPYNFMRLHFVALYFASFAGQKAMEATPFVKHQSPWLLIARGGLNPSLVPKRFNLKSKKRTRSI
jgi:hypothetical protein